MTIYYYIACLISKASLVTLIMALYTQPLLSEWDTKGLEDKSVHEVKRVGEEIFASTDSGIYNYDLSHDLPEWVNIGFPQHRISSMLVMSRDSIIVSIFPEESYEDSISLYRTYNGGIDWEPSQNGFGGEHRKTRAFTLTHYPEGPCTIFGTSYAFVAKSDDCGKSWRLVWGDWDGIGMGVHFLEYHPVDSHIVWSGGEDGIFQPFVLISSDSGESFEKRHIPLTAGDNAVYSAAFIPESIETVYIGMEGILGRTIDGGSTWESLLTPPDYPYFYGIEVHPYDSSIIYTTGARNIPSPQEIVLYITDDGGVLWDTVRSDIYGHGVFDLFLEQTNDYSLLYFGVREGGVYTFLHTALSVPGYNGASIPEVVTLYQNYPNPFNNTTVIRFLLPSSMVVRVDIYNVSGGHVATVVGDEALPRGLHTVEWNAEGISSGVYYCRLKADDNYVIPMSLVR